MFPRGVPWGKTPANHLNRSYGQLAGNVGMDTAILCRQEGTLVSVECDAKEHTAFAFQEYQGE